jgi:hypothetical protein
MSDIVDKLQEAIDSVKEFVLDIYEKYAHPEEYRENKIAQEDAGLKLDLAIADYKNLCEKVDQPQNNRMDQSMMNCDLFISASKLLYAATDADAVGIKNIFPHIHEQLGDKAMSRFLRSVAKEDLEAFKNEQKIRKDIAESLTPEQQRKYAGAIERKVAGLTQEKGLENS